MVTRRQAALLLAFGPCIGACQSLGLSIAAVQWPLRPIGLQQLATVLDACPAVVSLQRACMVVATQNGCCLRLFAEFAVYHACNHAVSQHPHHHRVIRCMLKVLAATGYMPCQSEEHSQNDWTEPLSRADAPGEMG